MEGINTNECLFKIEFSDITIRRVHINTDKFNMKKLLRSLKRLEVKMKIVLFTAR